MKFSIYFVNLFRFLTLYDFFCRFARSGCICFGKVASALKTNQVFYGEKRVAIGKILRQLCEWKGVNIVGAEMCPDHVHMLVEIPPKIAVSSFMGYLKGKSSTMLYEQFGELKYKYRNREFWCRGYYVDTVGKNTSRIAEYIRKQLEEDKLGEQLTLPINGPFTGGK